MTYRYRQFCQIPKDSQFTARTTFWVFLLTIEGKNSVSSASHKKVSLLGVDLHMRHAQKQGRKVLSTFMNDRKTRKNPRCKTAGTFETRAQIMLEPHCACVSYNSSGYLDTCKRFALTRVPSTRISGYLAIRIRVNAASAPPSCDDLGGGSAEQSVQ